MQRATCSPYMVHHSRIQIFPKVSLFHEKDPIEFVVAGEMVVMVWQWQTGSGAHNEEEVYKRTARDERRAS